MTERSLHGSCWLNKEFTKGDGKGTVGRRKKKKVPVREAETVPAHSGSTRRVLMVCGCRVTFRTVSILTRGFR